MKRLLSHWPQSAGAFLLLVLLAVTGCRSTKSCCDDNSCCAGDSKKSGVNITQETNNTLRIEINGQLFTEYHYKESARPYFYPVIGPDESPMTRNWPMKDVPGEQHDPHPHHRSLWYAHGLVNGMDFWSDLPGHCTIQHAGFTQIKSGMKEGVIKSRDNWVDTNGNIVCTDDRVFRVYNYPANKRVYDFEITLHASHGDVTFNDTKEGSMAMRVAETMRVKSGIKGKKGLGHIVNSEGQTGTNAWGKRADWCDYYGPVNSNIVGIAIFDNPHNPRHPTTWHVRDYGLFAVNPFGLHDFENAPPGAGDMKIPAGKSVTFKYRFYLHEGDEKQAKVAEMYAEYAKSSK